VTRVVQSPQSELCLRVMPSFSEPGEERMPALPTPRMSATVTPAPSRVSLGRVTITLEPALVIEADAPEAEEPIARSPRGGVCSLCKLPGHTRSNRQFHPRRI